MEEINLKDRVNSIDEKLDALLESGKKSKPFKLPMKAKVSKSKVKKNWITICKINENRGVDFTREPIENQTVVIDGIPRLATGEDVLNYKGKPLMIIPSWSVKPFSPSDSFNNSLEDGSNTKGYSLLLARMKAGAMELKKKVNMILILALIAGVGIAAYTLLK